MISFFCLEGVTGKNKIGLVERRVFVQQVYADKYRIIRRFLLMEEQAVISSKERYRTLLVSGGGLFSQSASTMLLSFVLASMITSLHIIGTAGGFI